MNAGTIYQYPCGCEYGHVIVATGDTRWTHLRGCLNHPRRPTGALRMGEAVK